jgi:hypothetical protein
MYASPVIAESNSQYAPSSPHIVKNNSFTFALRQAATHGPAARWV